MLRRPLRVSSALTLTMVELKINTRDIEKVIDKILGHFTFLLQKEIIKRIPLSFRNRIVVSREGAAWIVGSNSEIFRYYIQGTKPHIIRPKFKKALSFKWPSAPMPPNSPTGSFVFKEVKHPGTKGNNVIDEIEQDTALLERLLDRAILLVSS